MDYRANLKLGKRVHKCLIANDCENPKVIIDPKDVSIADITKQFFEPLKHWIDLNDASQQGTPRRVAKMYQNEIFYGLDYTRFPDIMAMPNKEGFHNPVILQNIPVKSMCEHHFMPIVGVCTIAYIPDQFVAGLSKFNRVVDFFCRRPQMQERLTKQIRLAFREILCTEAVAVHIKAKHMCVSHRGKNDHACETITYEIPDRDSPTIDHFEEFLQIARHSNIVD